MLLSLLTGCQQYDGMENGKPVELSFRIATSSTATRGGVTDYPTTPSQWTQAERLVDGRYMYYLSVYIVNSENAIVASKENIEIDGQATEYTVIFDQSYGLKRGNYKLLAVANNTAHTIGGTTYNSGLVGTWESSDYESLMDNLIAGNATDNISPRDMVQPLSLVKDIELHAGNNVVDGELIRTFARIRIEIKNNSGTLPLQIKGLSFSDNFTQKQAYVFDDGTDRKYFDPTSAPVSTSLYALQPFTTDDGSDYKTIASMTSAVVFDSYLLESRAAEGENYTYTLDLAYEEGTSSITYTFEPDWDKWINRIGNLNVGDESYFLIYNSGDKGNTRYLSAGEDKVTTATLSNNSTTVATDNVWQLISTGLSNEYYIKNVETGLYMQSPESNSVALGTNPATFSFDEVESKQGKQYYITIKGGDRYLSINNNGSVQGKEEAKQESRFRFYPVNKVASESGSEPITYNTPITLTTIDPITQQSSPATAIKRNDFINVLVTVSYNPESGIFEFYVQDWNTGGGSVEFE